MQTNNIRQTKRHYWTRFGVAMSSLFVANEIHADILDISWNGGQSEVKFSLQYTSYNSALHELILDQVGSTTDFSVFNTMFSLNADGQNTEFVTTQSMQVLNLSIDGVAQATEGEVINPENLTDLQKNLSLENLTRGDHFFAFKTADNNVGWFRLSVNESGDFCFNTGELGDEGEALMVGDEIMGDVNCDGAVDLLDITPFVELLAGGNFSSKADFNLDGTVSLLDVGPFVNALSE